MFSLENASIRVALDDRQVQAALSRLLVAGSDMTPLMRDIGEHLRNTTRKRFEDEEAPDGTPWAPLSSTTPPPDSHGAMPAP